MKEVPTANMVLLWAAATAWGVLSGCNRPEPEKPSLPEVTVAKPYQADVVSHADFTGKTRETESLDVRARVQGFLKSINFADGSDVKEGQLLFVIEPEPFEAKVTEAQARLESAKAQLVLAQSNLERAAKLVASKAISMEEFNTRTAQRDSAKAAVLAAEAALENAKIDLSYTQIHTPFPGRVSRHLVDVGNLVGAGENTLLTTVRKIEPIHAYFDIGEIDLLEYMKWRKQRGDDNEAGPKEKVVYLGLADDEGFPYTGEIDFIDNTVDASTGTMSVRAVFPNEDGMIPPGAFARIRVPGPPIENALLVDDRAIGTDLGGKFVLVIGDDDKVERRYIKAGQLVGGMRVVEKGLGPNDRYVSKGIQQARPGMPVKWTLSSDVPSLPVNEVIQVPKHEKDSRLPQPPIPGEPAVDEPSIDEPVINDPAVDMPVPGVARPLVPEAAGPPRIEVGPPKPTLPPP